MNIDPRIIKFFHNLDEDDIDADEFWNRVDDILEANIYGEDIWRKLEDQIYTSLVLDGSHDLSPIDAKEVVELVLWFSYFNPLDKRRLS